MYCKVKINNHYYNCYYETNGLTNKEPLVMLHGWGVDCTNFKNIINELNYYVVIIDLIGFGKSDHPVKPFKLEDYVSQVDQMINHLKLSNIILLGHSFGGRVAIKYNYYYNLNKLILVDSAGIKHKTLKVYKEIIKYKVLKKIYYYTNKQKYIELLKNSGSRDYKILSPIMKQTMNCIIKEDLRKYCKTTRTRTIILWGLKDNETPLSDAYNYYNIFYDSRLVVFYNSGHFPHLDESDKFIKVINYVQND